MQTPDRLTVPTCIGCGAMGEWGSCETGCREQRLDLVRAEAHDALGASRTYARRCADAFAPIADRLASSEPPASGAWETAYRELQEVAREALHQHPQIDWHEFDAPSEPAITWWCPDCGGLEAPQDCLGICVWRPVEWVRRDLYDSERERAVAERDREQHLRRLLRRVASITPRAGQWESTWQVLGAEARRAPASIAGPAPATG